MSTRVRLKPGEPAAVLMKRFKRACERDHLREQMRQAATYEKPSDMRRRTKGQRERRHAALARMGGR